ncbi:hypothetical protein DPV78_001934 [Talaromyces pinophilus]|nr:hypothetical protein DPV78_001934 [Talaromyces pinophilus]
MAVDLKPNYFMDSFDDPAQVLYNSNLALNRHLGEGVLQGKDTGSVRKAVEKEKGTPNQDK